MILARSYYDVLGLSPGADEQEVRAAYRRLVKDVHPDTAPSDASRFMEVKEAHDALMDGNGGTRGAAAVHGELFATSMIQMRITSQAAEEGGVLMLGVPLRELCPRCKGSGRTGLFRCRQCAGTGGLIRMHTMEPAFPAGIHTGDWLRVPLTSLGLPDQFLMVQLIVDGYPPSPLG